MATPSITARLSIVEAKIAVLATVEELSALRAEVQALRAELAELKAQRPAPTRTAPPSERPAPKAEWEILGKFVRRDGTHWFKVFRGQNRTSNHQVTEQAFNAWTPGTVGKRITQSMLAEKATPQPEAEPQYAAPSACDVFA